MRALDSAVNVKLTRPVPLEGRRGARGLTAREAEALAGRRERAGRPSALRVAFRSIWGAGKLVC